MINVSVLINKVLANFTKLVISAPTLDPSSPVSFDHNYFTTVYRDYNKQTPKEKLLFYKKCLTKFIVKKDGIRFLDLGCGMGHFLRFLPSSWDRSGFDVNNWAIDFARSQSSDITFFDNLIPDSQNNSFDVISALDVIEHISDFGLVLDNIKTLLRSDGIILIVVPVYDGPLGPIVHFLDRDPTHLHKNSRQWWEDQISLRFTIVEKIGIMRWMTPWNTYIHFPHKLFSSFAPGYVIIAKNNKLPTKNS